MSKPTIILVPGAWHSPEHFEPLAIELANYGYKALPIALPSNQSKDLPPNTLTDDVKAVRRTVEAELNAGNNVIIVAHSWGAVPTNNALQGLDKQSRGDRAAVLALVFISAAFVLPGSSFVGEFGGQPTPICNLQYPYVDVNKPGPVHWFFNDLPPDEANRWSEKVMSSSWKAYEEAAKFEAFKDIDSWDLITTLDNTLTLEVQQYFLNRARENGARFLDETIDEIAAGHAPFLSRVEETGAFIRKAAVKAIEGV